MKFNLYQMMIAVIVICCSCASEYPVTSPYIGTDIMVYSEFPKSEGVLHQMLHEQFTMNCSNNSSIVVHTPFHLTDDFITEPSINTQYKIVVGNDTEANTIYYKDARTEKLADALVGDLNEFLTYYFQKELKDIPQYLHFRKSSHLKENSYLSKLISRKNDTSLKLKIGVATQLERHLKEDFLMHTMAHLTHTLGSECAPIYSHTADLKVYLPDSCNCPTKQPKQLKVYEYWYWEM